MLAMTGIAALLLTGCGVPKAEAPHDNVKAMQMRDFPPQNWRLNKSMIFLWKKDMTPANGYNAEAISDRIDDLDWAGIQLSRQDDALNAKIALLQDPVNRLTGILTSATNDTTAANQALTAEKAKVPPLPEAIALLTAEVAKLKANQDSISSNLAAVQANLQPLVDQEAQVSTQLMSNQTDYLTEVNQIMAETDWYVDAPAPILFGFKPDGSISCTLTAWSMSDDSPPLTFSTDALPGKKPTVGNITYTVRGGVFAFEVYVYQDAAQTKLQYTFSFRMARTKYDSPDGRVYFGGEVIRTGVVNGKTETRYGLAQFVDKVN